MLNLGVDGLITNDPEMVLSVVMSQPAFGAPTNNTNTNTSGDIKKVGCCHCCCLLLFPTAVVDDVVAMAIARW